MLTAALAILAGLALLVWSADRFVDGAAATARHFRVPALLIGMVIVGFGTSAPEMVVSALAASAGNPALALGNAYGSNIANIGLILGITAVCSPIAVRSGILRQEMPALLAVTALSALLLYDDIVSRLDAVILLLVFACLMSWAIVQGLRNKSDALASETDAALNANAMPLSRALLWLLVGLVLMIGSSQLLVWGATHIARLLGVSDLIIGLTIVAVGTSLPELASSIAAVRKKEHDIALGNVIGSNLFNTLAVVGIAGAIKPITGLEPEILSRDILAMGLLSIALFVFAYGFRGPSRINRLEGALLLAGYVGYNSWLGWSVFTAL